jgi:hypothetical protein
MMSLKLLSDKLEELRKMLVAEPEVPVPDIILQKNATALDKLISSLRPFFTPSGPTKHHLKAAKDHPLGAQILSFISMNRDRKKFFDLGYFKSKYDMLGSNKEVVASFIKGETASTYAGALLVYYYWTRRPDGGKGLEALWQEIQSDYNNSPAARKQADARSFLKTLFNEKEVENIVASIQSKYPTVSDLKEFAKIASLKIPPAERDRNVPKRTAHERLAEAIHQQGGILRMELE